MNVFIHGCICLTIVFAFQNVTTANILRNQPSSGFNKYALVTPKIQHLREKRYISDTKKENGEHIDELQISLEIDNKILTLDLSLNKPLIPKGFFVEHQENEKNVVNKLSKEEINHCHYHGKVQGQPTSWVALSTCNGLSGIIYVGQELYYIEKDDSVAMSPLETPHFVYKHTDLVEQNKTCGFADTDTKDEHKHTTIETLLRNKRSAVNNELVHGPYNANHESKYVELILVVDNGKFKDLGESRQAVVSLCKNIANIVNALYAPLNIYIALVGVVIWTDHDEINFSTVGDETLSEFLKYRRVKLNHEHANDNAQLVTKFTFDGGVVAKALKGPICSHEYSGGLNRDHSPVVGLIATTIAHSLGHNFGMEHDTKDCKCPDAKCIMSSSSSSNPPTHWSSCSLDFLNEAFKHGMDYCLKNKPESLFDGPVCGNGFVEPGEDCDSGLPENNNNTCCNADTCTLHAKATCATGVCCDLNTCKPKEAGTLCRSAGNECDLPEYCTGQSEYCPTNLYKMDTESCEGGEAFCYQGSCKTRTQQCKLLWGNSSKSSNADCYNLNTKGNRHGNCGYDYFNRTFYKCEPEDVDCGLLQCTHEINRLEFGMESVSIISHGFINHNGSIISCKTAIVDLGTQQINPGLVPEGSKCGEGKMCVDQKCRNIEQLRKLIPSCPKNCNGKGWCNSKGHCHCQNGFAPPLCESPGFGGSEDSGPAPTPNDEQVTNDVLVFPKKKSHRC